MNYLHDEYFWKIYNEERDKLSILVDIECDFEALEKAIIKYYKIKGVIK